MSASRSDPSFIISFYCTLLVGIKSRGSRGTFPQLFRRDTVPTKSRREFLGISNI